MIRRASTRRRGRGSRREEDGGPTPETLAKLRPDPLLALLQAQGDGDGALERAADEIRAVYLAVCGMMMAGVGGRHGYGRTRHGHREMPSYLAWVHRETYLPWANGQARTTLEATIGLIVDRQVQHPDRHAAIATALNDYAERLRRRGSYDSQAAATVPQQSAQSNQPEARMDELPARR